MPAVPARRHVRRCAHHKHRQAAPGRRYPAIPWAVLLATVLLAATVVLPGMAQAHKVAAATATSGTTHGAPPAPESLRALRAQEKQRTGLYRAWFPDLAIARRAAVTLHGELMETDYAAGWQVFELDGAQIAMLQRFGYARIEPATDFMRRRDAFVDAIEAAAAAGRAGGLDDSSVGIQAIPGYACYETVEETYATATGLAATYPQLARWNLVGQSWQKTAGAGGYDIGVLVLSNSAVQPAAGPKPKLFIHSAMHAREYVTAPLALAFARQLLLGHGVDADMTWVLDHHEVHLMLHVNPDGRKRAEAGLSWRKNTNTAYCGATSNSRGADLNRNFSFGWNTTNGQGSSGTPCNATYRGPTSSSEPETRVVEAYVRGLWPDRRGPQPGDAAPADTSGIHIDLHSYSQLVLWPWGATAAPAPNGTALATLGRRFAWFNNYSPTQSIGLYPTDGTSDGPSYGELGVAAYTFELGTSFFQTCSVFDNTIKPNNLPALLYAAKVVRAPYLLPAGPEVTALVLAVAGPVPAGAQAALTGTATDTRFNQSNGSEAVQAVTAATAYIATPPWEPGAVALPLQPADGSFDSSTEALSGSLPTAGLPPGRHLVYVQASDASGQLGPVSAVFLDVAAPTITLTATLNLIRGTRYAANLRWSGATGVTVDFWRNGIRVKTVPNSGKLSESLPGPGTRSYKICLTGSATLCSATQQVSY